MKKAILVLIVLLMTVGMFAACQPASAPPAATTSAPAASGVRTVAERADALPGESITPKDFNRDFLPGLEEIGAVPLKKYKIAFSNGDMSNEWRRSFWDDFVSFAKLYTDRFGIEFISANSGNNSVKQLQDIQGLISQKPDLLIISPNESGPLTAVVAMCEEAKIPLITIDRALDVKPGQGLYISAIQIDGYRSGIAQGIALVEKLTEKYGEPKGNVAEIPGILGASPSRLTSMGLRRVLKDYPNIKIVTVRPGEYDREISFKAAQDILTVNKAGTLDAILTSADDASLAAIEAVKSAGRDELLGYIFSVDGTVGGIQALLDGEMAEISEEPPYFGLITFEYAIHYLNGKQIPSIVPIPQRAYTVNTPEKKEQLKKMMETAISMNLQFVPSSEGGYDTFVLNREMVQKYYPKPYWDQPAEYLTEFEPYTEMK